MAILVAREWIRHAQNAGYTVVQIEQLRPNRLLLNLTTPDGTSVLAMVQARPSINAGDVQDLAEIARLRRPEMSLLVACDGNFSPMAHQTVSEIGNARLRLCSTLPPANLADGRIPQGKTVQPLA